MVDNTMDKLIALPDVQTIKKYAKADQDKDLVIHLRKMLRNAKAIGYGEALLRKARGPPEGEQA